jgi:hypothetical protein
VNIALIALPPSGKAIYPPLTLAYLATLLEQRRHIVRIYDLGLEPQVGFEVAFQPLRLFRPRVIVIAGEQPELINAAVKALPCDGNPGILSLPMSRSGLDAAHVCTSVLQWLGQQQDPAELIAPLRVDTLPLPARHLLSLESYSPRAVGGELQTTLMIGAVEHNGRFALRAPAQIVSELRSVSHEFGLRHYLIPDVLITMERPWLVELLARLCDAQLGVSWEASAQLEQLDADLLAQMAHAGCESLCLQLDASNVFESTTARDTLRQAVAIARQNHIFVQANLKLEPPYESIPHLVDVAATFGLDDVSFDVARVEAASVGADETQLRQMARQIYDQGRDRQRLIQRFGPALGNLIWRLRGPRSSTGQLNDESMTA